MILMKTQPRRVEGNKVLVRHLSIPLIIFSLMCTWVILSSKRYVIFKIKCIVFSINYTIPNYGVTPSIYLFTHLF